MIDIHYVISSHMNPYLSGVAKFNVILGQKLGAQCLGIEEIPSITNGAALFSLKIRDCSVSEQEKVYDSISYLIGKSIEFDVFFHAYDNLDIERELVRYCRKVYCGNSEIAEQVKQEIGAEIKEKIDTVWCPSLINDHGELHESALNIFSFGMAHKIQIDNYRRLSNFLEKTGLEYSLWISTAFHEKASFGDFNSISTEIKGIFGGHVQFLGFLSDDAVNYFLTKAHLFVAFFEKGVRANNTSVLGAMQKGCAPLVNCDAFSPDWMDHGSNILDINKVTLEHLNLDSLKEVGKKARRDVCNYSSWEKLQEKFEITEKYHVTGKQH